MELDVDPPPQAPKPPAGRGHRTKRPSRIIRDIQLQGPHVSTADKRRIAAANKKAREDAALAALQQNAEEETVAPIPAPERDLEPGGQPTDPSSDAERPIHNGLVSRFRTLANAFGIWREYNSVPISIPDLDLPSQTRSSPHQLPENERASMIAEIISPWPNLSAFKIAHLVSTLKSVTTNLSSIFRNVLLDPTIIREDIEHISFEAYQKKTAESSTPWEEGRHGWRKTNISIAIPSGTKEQNNRAPTNITYETEGYWYRPLIPHLRTVLTSPDAKRFHYEPYCHWWSKPNSPDPPMRVIDELYTSDTWLTEHEKIQKIHLPPEEPDTYPRAVVPLMFWSDSTHLADFGQAKLWPIYMAVGNQSKYERSKPGNRAMHHLAYIPSVCGIY